MLTITPIPAFTDNYIWMIAHTETKQAVVVDPGQAEPVLDALKETGYTLTGILVTHHHFDHTGGIGALVDTLKIPVYGPANDGDISCDHFLKEGDQVTFPSMQLHFEVLDIPGHTKGHIAFFTPGMLFCGDTLFSAGCGRLFEGTALQMFNSLSKLAALPANTKVYCAHEYTESNLAFAKGVEPNNPAIENRITAVKELRHLEKPSLPSTIAIELKTNPFLRTDKPEVIEHVKKQTNQSTTDPVSIFASLRHLKDQL